MKRPLLLIAAAAVVLAACTKNDVVISDADPMIEFDAPFVGKSVKATGDLTTRNIQEQSLRIWGDKYRAGESNASDVYSTNAADGASTVLSYAKDRWLSNKYAYWTSGYLYDFTSVAPASVNASYNNSSTTLSERKLTISDIPVVQLIKDLNGTVLGDDILAATNTGKSIADRTVSVSLHHLLSRFSIYLYTTFAQQTVDVESIKIYLPKNSTAEYAQAAHGRIASGTDVWTWNGFTNKP
ncbi:MAG: fimbrillin family protein, partial [Bacteroidales bacterium]|nr:fimbrillin family protein [Bacteroidales bacterium]